MEEYSGRMIDIIGENELAIVLSHYNSEYVFTVVKDAIDKRFTNTFIKMPNVVNAWEQNFKAIIDNYGSDSVQEVIRVRNETYNEIISIICREYGLNFTVADIDIFTAAYKLYQLFVCDFNDFITNFFVRYIYKERVSIYESMGLADAKKNKDSSTVYAKRIYKDPRIAIINACIDKVVSNICGMDFDLYTIINTSIISKELVQYYISIISPTGDFFKDSILPVLNSDIRSVFMTNIRFKLHGLALAHDQINPTMNDIIMSNETNTSEGE